MSPGKMPRTKCHYGFVPRDAACLCATLVYCIQTAKDIVKLHPRLGSVILEDFFSPSAVTQFQGDPSAGAIKH